MAKAAKFVNRSTKKPTKTNRNSWEVEEPQISPIIEEWRKVKPLIAEFMNSEDTERTFSDDEFTELLSFRNAPNFLVGKFAVNGWNIELREVEHQPIKVLIISVENKGKRLKVGEDTVEVILTKLKS